MTWRRVDRADRRRRATGRRADDGRQEALFAIAFDKEAEPSLSRAAGRAIAVMSYVRNRSFDESANLFADEANLGHGEEMDRLYELHRRRPGDEGAAAFVAGRTCPWWWSCLRDDVEAATHSYDDGTDWPEPWRLLTAKLPAASTHLLVVTSRDLSVAVFDTHHDELVVANRAAGRPPAARC